MPSSVPAMFARYAIRASVVFVLATAAQAGDPIVGTWVGKLSQPDNDPFDVSLTFVSPKGGVSRYPGVSLWWMLVGDRKGDSYEYEETITYGGTDEGRSRLPQWHDDRLRRRQQDEVQLVHAV